MKHLFCLLVFGLLCASGAERSIALRWDPNSETNIANYRLHWAPPASGLRVVPGSNTTVTLEVTNFPPGQIVFFLTAVNDAGLESYASASVSWTNRNFAPVLRPVEDTNLVSVLLQSASSLTGPWTNVARVSAPVLGPGFHRGLVVFEP